MISRIMDNMTSEEIAKKLHCTAAAVYSWKSGERAPQYHARRAIAALYQSVK